MSNRDVNVIVSALCLSLLLALGSCDNPLAETCGQLCQQTCDVVSQLFSVFSVFLGPLLNTGSQLCSTGCSLVCGIFG
ncbi:hypothetical protein ElyMa_004144700 [Elysia marginata]|uniref:Uncharacterized protein n=1 Tax=Elysia marginata TaxID=1093978 RepID=A0AAV4GFZ6_9GAST|nr:hypothetical protein ElyMa_004144700 [Elysia marginata]